MSQCFCCHRTPDEISVYVEYAEANEETPEAYVYLNEGTFNGTTKTFACDECYLAIGAPANRFPEPPWKAPAPNPSPCGHVRDHGAAKN